MMDLIPTLVDGAIVYNLQNSCNVKSNDCENCSSLVIYLHNWLKQADLNYLIVDLQDSKDICIGFLESIVQLHKRLKFPFLFAGAMEQARVYFEAFNYGNAYPLFITPEDAVRALRIQHPGITEAPIKAPITFETSFYKLLRSNYYQGEPDLPRSSPTEASMGDF